MARPLIGVCTSIQHGARRGDAYFLYTAYVAMLARTGALPFLLPFARTHEEAVEVLDRVDGLLTQLTLPGIGGHMAQLYKTFPTLDCAA